jgi:hypothetical protein
VDLVAPFGRPGAIRFVFGAGVWALCRSFPAVCRGLDWVGRKAVVRKIILDEENGSEVVHRIGKYADCPGHLWHHVEVQIGPGQSSIRPL